MRLKYETCLNVCPLYVPLRYTLISVLYFNDMYFYMILHITIVENHAFLYSLNSTYAISITKPHLCFLFPNYSSIFQMLGFFMTQSE